MSEHGHGNGGQNPEIKYERADVSAGAIVRFLLYLVIASAAVAVAMRGMFVGLARYEAGQQPPPPIMQTEPHRLPPLPRLQEHPTRDLAQLRADEDAVLKSYGWVDPQAGIVRIPVDEAMRLVAERGLPVRGQTPAATPAPAAQPGGKK